MTEKPLSSFTPGEKGVVHGIFAKGMFRKRLMDMGVTTGAEIIMRKTAPLGDPIEITVRGYELSIRKEDAKEILLTKGAAVI